MPKSAYIHIPFCKKKCNYCSFVSYNKPDSIVGYMYSLMKEISENYKGERLNTLYFGGGTPSLIPADLILKVINKFEFENTAEITLELNPDDASIEYLSSLKSANINRLSIGSQTFNNNILSLIGRRHNADQIKNSINLAKECGFLNISIDLIYGLPTQTMDDLKYDIEQSLDMGIQHISTYGLKIEENTEFWKNMPMSLPDEDTQADMYEYINNVLESEGYKRYEISNFSKPGYESKHNLNYWNNNEYYGFGVSAHGYIDGIRYYNTSSIEEYMSSPASHKYGKFITEQEKLEEEIFLGFRKSDGINIENFNAKFNTNFEKKYERILTKYSEYFEKTLTGYKLNIEGILLSNIILAEFLE